MNVLDAILVGAAVLAVVGGYRLGFTTRVLSWVGLAVGLVVGMRVLPRALERIDPADHVRVVLLTVGVVVVFAAIGQAAGLWAGNRLAPDLRTRGAIAADRALGAVAGLVGLIALAWVVLPVLQQTPGWPGQLTTGSALARAVDDHLPAAPDLSQALRSLVGSDNFPQVFDAFQPSGPVGAPPPASGLSDAVAATAARSVVKVEGVACRRIQDGTGWVVADDLVVTNAHVVAGEGSSEIERNDGRRLGAVVVAFDPERDLALLRVKGLDRAALPVASATKGQVGGVFGHPGGEPLRIAPFSIARQIDATGRDIYDGASTRRQVLELAASLRPGDSGSALIDASGEVIGVAFAISTDQAGVAYALATSELTPLLDGPHDAEVSTGSCLS
ncbi:MAG: MarP family serine protease [Acidimicrobiales bacterium]